MNDATIIADYTLGDLLAIANDWAVWFASDIRLMAALLLVPVILSLFSLNGWLVTGLLGLTLTFFLYSPVGAPPPSWLPFLPLLPFAFAGFAVVTAVGGIRARRRLNRLAFERGMLRSEVRSVGAHLERERLWRSAGGSMGVAVSDDELLDIRKRLDAYLNEGQMPPRPPGLRERQPAAEPG